MSPGDSGRSPDDAYPTCCALAWYFTTAYWKGLARLQLSRERRREDGLTCPENAPPHSIGCATGRCRERQECRSWRFCGLPGQNDEKEGKKHEPDDFAGAYCIWAESADGGLGGAFKLGSSGESWRKPLAERAQEPVEVQLEPTQSIVVSVKDMGGVRWKAPT